MNANTLTLAEMRVLCEHRFDLALEENEEAAFHNARWKFWNENIALRMNRREERKNDLTSHVYTIRNDKLVRLDVPEGSEAKVTEPKEAE